MTSEPVVLRGKGDAMRRIPILIVLAGVLAMRLFSGTGPERGPTITVKGGGPNLPLPPLPLALPARLQLQQTNGDCWEATYATDGVLRNDATEFQGKAAVP